MGYTKLFQSIVTSSMWDESCETRVVWVTMLAMANQDGYVGATQKSLAVLARVSEEACEKALEIFMSPDAESRTKEHEGRRVEKVDGGWVLLNYEKHRNATNDDPAAAAARERQKRYREKLKAEETGAARVAKPASAVPVPAEKQKVVPEDLKTRVGKYAGPVMAVFDARPEFGGMQPEDIAEEIIKAKDGGANWEKNLKEFCADVANAPEAPKNPLGLLRKYLNNTRQQQNQKQGRATI